MNEINVKRMVLGGFATLVTWIACEIVIEGILADLLLGGLLEDIWADVGGVGEWTAANVMISTGLGLVNSILLIWLYASLRPMFGVGTKTALITSAFFIVFGWSLVANVINLGLLPAPVAIVEGIFETIEFPIAILAGAHIYEDTGREKVAARRV